MSNEQQTVQHPSPREIDGIVLTFQRQMKLLKQTFVSNLEEILIRKDAEKIRAIKARIEDL